MFCSRCGLNVTIEYAAVPSAPAPDIGDETIEFLNAELAGRYELSRELGRGGMATVYLASDVKHEREVAIKVLHPELAASIGGERFEREIKMAAKLQHPHILALYDSGVAGELLFYVMPFVKGESLRDKLDREKMLPVDEAIGITLEVADALGYAHAQGIVHRDIKPENIMLTGGHALVADFGIARPVGEQGGGGRKLTQTGMSIGTPVYMAPEQAAGEAAGPTADIYSLGCMLYEMLAGEPPFTGPTPMAIMARHLMEQVPSVRIVRNAVPEEVEAAIFAALGKMPVDRPQTAQAFAEIMGMPPGTTATMRARVTTGSMRRIPTGSQYAMPIPAAVPWWKRPATLAVVGVGAVAIAAAYGVWSTTRGGANISSLDDPTARRIAVLYFNSQDSSLAPLANGLTDGLMDALGNSTTLTIVSRSGVEPFRGSTVPVDSIARALRAGYLVRGDVEKEGANVRVSVRLDDRTGTNIDRASLVVPAGNALGARDSLAVLASNLIKQKLGQDIQVRAQRADTRSEAAWLLVQRGLAAQRTALAALTRGDSAASVRGFREADSLFVAAENADRSWPVPLVQRANQAYSRARRVGADPTVIRPLVSEAIALADSALALDGNNADAYEIRGGARYFGWLSQLDTDAGKKAAALKASKEDLEKATSINTRQAGAWASLSHLYNNDPASTTTNVSIAAQRALDADEFLANANLVLYRLFLAAYDLGQADAATQHCAQLRERFPTDPRSMRCQLYAQTSIGFPNPNIDLAWRLADSLAALEPQRLKERETGVGRMLVAATIARLSKSNPALADSARAVAKRGLVPVSADATRETAFRGAFVYTILGDKDDAIRLLTDYFAANPNRVSVFASDPGWWFRDLSAEPRFQRLIGR